MEAARHGTVRKVKKKKKGVDGGVMNRRGREEKKEGQSNQGKRKCGMPSL